METLHIRGESKSVEAIVGMINQISKQGAEIEIIDDFVFRQEQKMILQGIYEEQNGETVEHSELWRELLG